jgi:hypothetical protein
VPSATLHLAHLRHVVPDRSQVPLVQSPSNGRLPSRERVLSDLEGDSRVSWRQGVRPFHRRSPVLLSFNMLISSLLPPHPLSPTAPPSDVFAVPQPTQHRSNPHHLPFFLQRLPLHPPSTSPCRSAQPRRRGPAARRRGRGPARAVRGVRRDRAMCAGGYGEEALGKDGWVV